MIEGQIGAVSEVQCADELGSIAYLYIVVSICRYKYSLFRATYTDTYRDARERAIGVITSRDEFLLYRTNLCMIPPKQLIGTLARAASSPQTACLTLKILETCLFWNAKGNMSISDLKAVPRLEKNIIVVLETGEKYVKKTQC